MYVLHCFEIVSGYKGHKRQSDAHARTPERDVVNPQQRWPRARKHMCCRECQLECAPHEEATEYAAMHIALLGLRARAWRWWWWGGAIWVHRGVVGRTQHIHVNFSTQSVRSTPLCPCLASECIAEAGVLCCDRMTVGQGWHVSQQLSRRKCVIQVCLRLGRHCDSVGW